MFEPANQQTLLVSEVDRATLATMLGHGSTDSSQSLTRAVLRLARLSIGEIKVDFTVLQWEELTRRAQKRGLKIGVYMQRMIDRVLQDLWTSLD